ncbi:HU family DNA-binding protein (plasmid) [Priestia megaterium]|uniref:HU family DNA-binding protein n=1 Tax=Priestia megaterium TaxID=1404 RepID=UPI00389C2D2B
MKKAKFIEAVASKSELTKQDTKKAVDALFETISTTLAKGEKKVYKCIPFFMI